MWGQVKLEMYLPVGQVKFQFHLSIIFKYVALSIVCIDIGQVDFIFGQVKVQDHLPGGRQR